MSESLQRTPLHALHREAGARFTEFGGWEMPVQYEGVVAEHRAVRSAVGLFDVSHMGEIEVSGKGALALCRRIATNDAALLAVGRAQYTLWCDEQGGTIDDTILYRVGDERYLFCVNAGNARTCADWIRARADEVEDVVVHDASEDFALIAMQGPRAAALVERIGGEALATLPRFGCATAALDGAEVFGARTGYTGEDGFELFVAAAAAPELWRRLVERGRDLGVRPIGLGARDTLRLEAGLPLYGHELARDISPLEAGLGWAVKLGRPELIGGAALTTERERGPRRRLIGLRLMEPGVARAGYAVLTEGREIGAVTSGTMSPSLGVAIALALVETESLDAPLNVEIRSRSVAAERVPLPFYRRAAVGESGGGRAERTRGGSLGSE
jgi:aminomethyltransferase